MNNMTNAEAWQAVDVIKAAVTGAQSEVKEYGEGYRVVLSMKDARHGNFAVKELGAIPTSDEVVAIVQELGAELTRKARGVRAINRAENINNR